MQAGRSNRGGNVAVIAIVAIAALVLIWLTVRWFSGPPRLVQDDGRKTAEGFLLAVREGKVDEAWTGTTAEFKSLMGQEEFRKTVKGSQELLSPTEFEGFESKPRDGLALAEYKFRPLRGSGKVVVLLAPEGNSWKVERVAIDRPSNK